MVSSTKECVATNIGTKDVEVINVAVVLVESVVSPGRRQIARHNTVVREGARIGGRLTSKLFSKCCQIITLMCAWGAATSRVGRLVWISGWEGTCKIGFSREFL